MSEFTPTIEQARSAYVRSMRLAFVASAGEHAEEFDRFVASIRNAALDEAVAKVNELPINYGSIRMGPPMVDSDLVLSAIRALKEEKK